MAWRFDGEPPRRIRVLLLAILVVPMKASIPTWKVVLFTVFEGVCVKLTRLVICPLLPVELS